MIGIKAPRFPARERVEADAVVGLNPFNEAVVGEDGGLVVVLLFSEDGTVTMMSGRGVGRFVFFLYCIDTRCEVGDFLRAAAGSTAPRSHRQRPKR